MKEADDLDEIKVCINENYVYGPNDFFDKRCNMSVSTWLKLYNHLRTPKTRVEFRIAATAIAQTFRHDKTIISKHGTFAAKFESSIPYNFFLSIVDELEETSEQPYSVSFHEILDYTGGEIVESLHLNYMVELLWIITEYMLAAQNPKMTILYGTLVDPQHIYDIPFDVNLVEVKMPEFGCHHSKISILKYKDESIRIIISTANLYYLDWRTRTQGLWISPILPHLAEDAEDTDGESVTNFKKDFIAYLSIYKEPDVYGWQALMHRTDFSAVKVFFLTSVPGNHEGPYIDLYGHKRLYAILSEHAILPFTARDWPIVAQSSAVGVFGQQYQGSWLQNHIVQPMSKEKEKRIIHLPHFKYIYPSNKNYSQSFDSQIGATCLMYNEENHQKQPWIKSFLHEWKSDKTDRSRAMPHCKCYTRISPDETEIPWFVLTSANVSKGAWGKMLRGGTCHCISNYEAGVVFIPDIMIHQIAFPIKQTEKTKAPLFLLPYDLPLTLYKPEDDPFVIVKSSEPVPSAEKIDEQEKPRKKLTPVAEIARQLRALKEEAKREQEKAEQLMQESNKSQDVKVGEHSEELLEKSNIMDVEEKSDDKTSVEEEEGSEQMSQKSSEVEDEEQKSKDKERVPRYDLFASV